MKLRLSEPVYQRLIQVANQADTSAARYLNNLIEQHVYKDIYDHDYGRNKKHRSR